MKVLYKVYCLENTPQHGPCEADWKIKAQETYDVIREHHSGRWGLYLELSHQPGVAYPCEYFVRLPDTTEEIATEHEHEAIIYQR